MVDIPMTTEFVPLDELPDSIYIPKGNGAVAKSAFFKEIIDRICSGWHPRKLERWLRTECNEFTVTEAAIGTYTRKYLPKNLLHFNTQTRQALQEFEAKVDEVGILEKMILDQQERVAALLEMEQQEGSGKVRSVKDEMELLTKMLISSVKVKQSLGIMNGDLKEVKEGEFLISEEDKKNIPMNIADKVLRIISTGGIESVVKNREIFQ